MRRRTIKGALPNFLGTYTSRYSDYDGYWIFGILLGSLGELQIDLLGPVQGDPQGPAIAAAIQLARQRFREQIEKAGSSISCTRDASLKIMRLPQPETGAVNGRICAGHRVRFVARVVSDLGKTYESEKCVFVAPHDPKVELRSARGT